MGLLFIAIIWCLHGFLSYKQVVHNSCNMCTRGLPDIYSNTLSPQACGPRSLDVYIRQTTRAHVTTIQYVLLKALPPVCMKYTARDESRVASIARGEAECYICHKTLIKSCMLSYKQKGSVLSVLLYFTLI